MTPRHRTELVNLSLEAQGENHRQARAGYDPSPEIDSALEHALWLAKHAPTDAHRHHAVEVARLLNLMLESNRVECEHERQIAGRVDRSGEWSLRRVVRDTSPALADLLNPVIGHTRREVAEDIVTAVILNAPADLLGTLDRPNMTLRHELGVRKFTALMERVEAAETEPAS